MPDLFHILPVSDDSVFDGVFEAKKTSHALGLVADKMITRMRDHFLERGREREREREGEKEGGGVERERESEKTQLHDRTDFQEIKLMLM